jgi:hypothetical protein
VAIKELVPVGIDGREMGREVVSSEVWTVWTWSKGMGVWVQERMTQTLEGQKAHICKWISKHALKRLTALRMRRQNQERDMGRKGEARR